MEKKFTKGISYNSESIVKNIQSLEAFFKSKYNIPILGWKERVKYEEIMKKRYPNYSSFSFTKKKQIIQNSELKAALEDEIKFINSLYTTGGEGKIEKMKDLEKIIEVIILKEIQLEIHQKNKLENKSNEPSEKKINKEINSVLEDMCIFGEKTKNEIQKDKIEHPEKYIQISEAFTMKKDDIGIFALALISKNLENLGIETAIVKNKNSSEEKDDLKNLQFLFNGMIHKKKFDLHFEFGEKRNNELLDNKIEYEKFKNKLKLKLSKDYNISPDKIIITLPKKGSFHVQVIFQLDDFNNLNKADFIKKFKNDPEFPELQKLKDIHEDVIIGAIKLTRNQLDSKGNRESGWAINEYRGGKKYIPPLGWIGIGLNVEYKYDNGDNTWLGSFNATGEWCVAYHGVGSGQNSENVKNSTGKIVKSEFKEGPGQAHKNCNDQFHPGKKVGIGVYCTPNIETAEGYAGIADINGETYKTALMVRVKPQALRHCDSCLDSKEPNNYWVVNGTTNEIRPYRILFKKC